MAKRHGPKGRNSRRRNQGQILPPRPKCRHVQFVDWHYMVRNEDRQQAVGYYGDVCIDGHWFNVNGYSDGPPRRSEIEGTWDGRS